MHSSFTRSALLLSFSTAFGCADTTNWGPEYQRGRSTSAATTGSGTPNTTSTAVTRKDPFDGAPDYASRLPDGRATLMHVNGKVAVVPGKDTKCLGCHASGGDEAAAPKFVFGGSVFDTNEATAGAKDMELGVIDANGKTVLVHSDEDGNFWAVGKPALAYPAYASIRFGDKKKAMKKKIVDASELECASCHDSSNRIIKP